MNEIEKMYKNAGCKGCCKHAEYGYEGEEGTWYYCKKESKECWTYPSGDADCAEKGYPLFTAEKQIEIIKFLISKHATFNKSKYKQKDLYMVYYECSHFPRRYFPFGEALAESINYLWQNLTEEEKQQVKGILE